MTRDPNHRKEALAELHSKMGFSIGQQCDIDTAKNIRCRWPSAIKSLQMAADLTNDPIDHVNLGWAYFRFAHPEAEMKNMSAAMPNLILAKAALEKAMTGSPQVVEYALQNLAAVQIDMGDQNGAIATLQKLIEKRPRENYLRYQMGVAYFKNNDFVNSEKAFREALEIDPNYVFALTGLGEALIGRKNGKEVKKVIERLRPIDAGAASRLELKLRIARL
jgi:tetratricopeptide (TPR) repeat protein